MLTCTNLKKEVLIWDIFPFEHLIEYSFTGNTEQQLANVVVVRLGVTSRKINDVVRN